MKKIVLLLSIFSLIFTTSCSEDDSNNISKAYMFLSKTTNFPVYDEPSTALEVEVGVTTKSSSDRTFSIGIDLDNSTATAAMYSLSSTTVTIPAGSYTGSVTVLGYYDELPLEGSRTLVLQISDAEDTIVSNSTNEISLYRACGSNAVTLSITFDSYPEESGWSLVDNGSGLTVASASAGTYAGQSSYTEEFCLVAGNYTFTFTDSWGDGMNGSYSLTHSDGTVLASLAPFGTTRSQTFTLN